MKAINRRPGRDRGVGFIQVILVLVVILVITVVALKMYQRATPPQALPGAGHPARSVLDRVELRIEGMTSQMDALQVSEALRRVPGVAGANADFSRGVARVTFHPGRTNREQLVAAVERAGYRVAR